MPLVSFLLTEIQYLKGIGPEFGKRLAKMGFRTFWDCLAHLPKKYDCYQKKPLAAEQSISAVIECLEMVSRNPWRIACKTLEGQPFELVFFRRPNLALNPGSKWIVCGAVTAAGFGNKRLQMVHPQRLLPFTGKELAPETILPHYTGLQNFSSSHFSKWIQGILQGWPPQHEDFPTFFKGPSLKACFTMAHLPSSLQMTHPRALWRSRLAYEELMAQQLSLLESRKTYHQGSPSCTPLPSTLEAVFLQRFGHPLTPSQEIAWQEIAKDLSAEQPMVRLLHGDVGSGKTLMAFLALIRVAASGHQCCLIAPTETLARQHYTKLCQWLEGSPLSVKLILGKGKQLGPKEALIVLGTHALLYDAVEFTSLALVVIDEQQRFGVMQRFLLTTKGKNPHLLLLSATPIPRTFEMVLWGHIPTSRIHRRQTYQPIENYLIPSQRIHELKAWIVKCLEQKERVYWICPLIQQDTSLEEDVEEDSTLTNGSKEKSGPKKSKKQPDQSLLSSKDQQAADSFLQALSLENEEGVLARYAYWLPHFPEQVAYLHGRMKQEEKDRVMEAFRNGTKPFLISTTVIEVGIDVPEASTIIIEDAPRFGLSQLHQLRGRVGRAHIQGHCFFLYTPPLSYMASQRLTFIKHCQDGFELAEKDWKLRGGGHRLGLAQSGIPTYRFVDLVKHQHLIQAVSENAPSFWLTESSKPLMRLFGYEAKEILKAG